MKNTYALAGVNVKIGDKVSKIFYEAAKNTWKNRKGKLGEVIVPFDDFSGIRVIRAGNLPKNTVLNFGFDGIGTAVEFWERNQDFSTLAYNLFAMVVDDAVVRGGEPVLLGSILDFNTLGSTKDNYLKYIKQLAKGYEKAANVSNVAIINGEVAELGSRVSGFGPFNFNWGAGLIWFAREDRLFTGHENKVGDYLVALEEPGFRSNGVSLARSNLTKKYGPNWHKVKFGGQTIGKAITIPATIYSPAVVDMIGGFAGKEKVKLSGVVHVTGGGIPGKLGRVLKPSGLGAIISDPFKPSALVKHVQEIGNTSDSEAYKTWHMGQGMLIISKYPDKVQKIASKFGINSKIAGQIVKKPGIQILNCGAFAKSNEYLTF